MHIRTASRRQCDVHQRIRKISNDQFHVTAQLAIVHIQTHHITTPYCGTLRRQTIGMHNTARSCDTACDSDVLRANRAEHGAETVSPPKTNRTVQRTFDRYASRDRHRIENFSLKSRNSVRSRHATTRPCPASQLAFIGLQGSSPHDRCQRSLE